MAGFRVRCLVAFTVVLLCGLPVWWQTTLVYRADLPYDNMFAAQSHYETLEAPSLHLSVSVSPDLPSSLPPSLLSQLATAFSGDTQSSWTVGPSSLALSTLPSTLTSLKEVDAFLAQTMAHTTQNGEYTLFVFSASSATSIPDVKKEELYLSSHRHAFVFTGGVTLSQLALTVAQVFVHSFSTIEDAGDAMSAPDHRFSFSLLVADPSACVHSWDFAPVYEKYFAPFLKALSHTMHISVDSQVLYYTPLATPTTQEHGKHFVSTDSLSVFINSNEWNVDNTVFEDPPRYFVVYVPPPEKTPLHIKHPEDGELAVNAFRLHQWGSVYLHNPSAACHNASLSLLSANDLQHILQLFAGHVRLELGLASLELEGVTVLPSPVGVSVWEVDALQRRQAATRLKTAARSLTTLSALIMSLPSMVVLDNIHSHVVGALSSLHRTDAALREGNFAEASSQGIAAWKESQQAFFHHSILSLLYFPDEHKLAIYVPLFVPVGVPLFLAIVKEIKARKAKKTKTE